MTRDDVRALLRWYRTTRRDLPWRRTRDAYRIWISEVMLQQTQVATVVPYYERFLARFPDVAALAAAALDDVLKAWEGLGYYGRARHLHAAAGQVVAAHAGRVPLDPAAFRRLPGVGDYIAAAVLSIAAGEPLPVVDGNVLRVWARWRCLREDVRTARLRGRIRRELAAVIPAAAPGDFNQALMELGARVCAPRSPRCAECPLAPRCEARRAGAAAELPMRVPRRKVPLVRIAVAVIVRRGRVFIQRRPDEGLLGGLWEFPGGKIEPGETPATALARECREEIGVAPAAASPLAEVRHDYSHFRAHLHVFVCRLDAGARPRAAGPARWVTGAELERYAFPGANRKFFPQLLDWLGNESALRRR
jgi:A/G-specific adenine glycosylase